MRGSTGKNNGVVLPDDAARTAKSIGERRIVLAAYRLSDVLKQAFEERAGSCGNVMTMFDIACVPAA
jgi:hypothetical protein